MTELWKRFLTAQKKTHVFQYVDSSREDQAIGPILATLGNLLSEDQRTEYSHKQSHQTSTQECCVSHCLASAHRPSLDLQQIQTLQKIVQNMDDTDKEFVSNRCGHCGAFLLKMK